MSKVVALLGREDERRVIDEVIAEARRGVRSLLTVTGEPGIGKSALLADIGHRHPDAFVVSVVGVEAEQSIPFAALCTMLGRIGDAWQHLDADTADTLGAVAVGNSPGTLFRLAIAIVDLLATLSEQQLVLLLLDDVHWFDPSSREVIELALRRIDHRPVATITTSRRSADSLQLAGTALSLGPLDRRSAQQLLDAGGTIDHDVAERCWEMCGGNPLTLVELGLTLTSDQRTGARRLPELLPVAERLERWFADRLDTLPPATIEALAASALAGTTPTPVLLRALEELGLTWGDLDPAHTVGVIDVRDGVVDFTHPVLRSVAASSVDAVTRRRIHRVLARATATTSSERRAWHLVEACETPEDVEAAVDGLRQLAERAGESGAHLTSADALVRLATFLPDADDRARALTSAGLACWNAGRPDLATPLLRAARELVPPGPTRAMAADGLGQVAGWSVSIAEARRVLEVEVDHVERDRPDLAVALLVSSATLASLAVSPDAVATAERAEVIASRGDHLTQLTARTAGTHVRLMAGLGADIADRLAETDELGALFVDGIDRAVIEPAQLLAFGQMVREQWATARATYARVVAAARAAALGGVETFALAMSAEVAWRTGRWTQARGEAAADAAFHSRLVGLRGTFGDATLARVEAALGMDADARTHASLAVERGSELGMHAMTAWGRHALALADLAAGEPEAALVHLEWIWDLVRASGATDAGLLWWQGDLLEALLAVGRDDDARHLVDELTRQAAKTGRRWPTAVAERGHGSLTHDPSALVRSIELLTALDAPFESARSRLVLASLLDGDDRCREADTARRTFERLGAVPWIARCRAMLGSGAGEGAPAPAPLAARLTPAELRVATAVGAGRSTREAATVLALSPRTVDAHLRSIFRKLNITSRSQLAVIVSASLRDHR